jgi:hypothetical protein
MGVRGEFTAEVLNDLGIKNVDIIGCPSLFRCNNPDLQINARKLEQIRKVAFNMRREVSATYAADIKRYLAVQRDFIKRLNKRFDLTVTSHGEPPEKAFFFKDDELIAKLARNHDALVTIEENVVAGGAGSACLESLAAHRIEVPVLRLGLPDRFIDHGDPAALLKECGLDAAGIAAAIRARFPELTRAVRAVQSAA